MLKLYFVKLLMCCYYSKSDGVFFLFVFSERVRSQHLGRGKFRQKHNYNMAKMMLFLFFVLFCYNNIILAIL